MKIAKMKYLIILLILLACGCSSYSITNTSFVNQINQNSTLTKTQNIPSLGTNYYSNNLSKIQCLDKNGQEIIINPDKNTNFKFTNKKTGKSTTLYYDTVYISGDSIFGLKSRILGGKRSMAMDDIDKIYVKTEN